MLLLVLFLLSIAVESVRGVGFALTFPSDTSVLRIPQWNFTGGPMTMFSAAMWLRQKNGELGAVWSYNSGTEHIGNYHSSFVFDSDVGEFRDTFAFDDWQHLVITWYSSTGILNVFRNGRTFRSFQNIAMGRQIHPGGELLFGQHALSDIDDRFANGFLAQVSFWSVALTSTQAGILMWDTPSLTNEFLQLMLPFGFSEFTVQNDTFFLTNQVASVGGRAELGGGSNDSLPYFVPFPIAATRLTQEAALEFPKNESAVANVQLDNLWFGAASTVDRITFAFWIRALPGASGTCLQYSTVALPDQLKLWDVQSFSVSICGKQRDLSFGANEEWSHVAVSWRATDGALVGYKNGLERTDIENVAKDGSIPSGGTLSLGFPSLSGVIIGHFSLWSAFMTRADVQSIMWTTPAVGSANLQVFFFIPCVTEETRLQNVAQSDSNANLAPGIKFPPFTLMSEQREIDISEGWSEANSTCSAGSWSPTGRFPCAKCPLGSFSLGDASTTCTLCAAGLTTEYIGASSTGSCAYQCIPGKYSSTGLIPCSPCPMGTYAPEHGRRLCIQCSQPYSTFSAGATSLSNCTFNLGTPWTVVAELAINPDTIGSENDVALMLQTLSTNIATATSILPHRVRCADVLPAGSRVKLTVSVYSGGAKGITTPEQVIADMVQQLSMSSSSLRSGSISSRIVRLSPNPAPEDADGDGSDGSDDDGSDDGSNDDSKHFSLAILLIILAAALVAGVIAGIVFHKVHVRRMAQYRHEVVYRIPEPHPSLVEDPPTPPASGGGGGGGGGGGATAASGLPPLADIPLPTRSLDEEEGGGRGGGGEGTAVVVGLPVTQVSVEMAQLHRHAVAAAAGGGGGGGKGTHSDVEYGGGGGPAMKARSVAADDTAGGGGGGKGGGKGIGFVVAGSEEDDDKQGGGGGRVKAAAEIKKKKEDDSSEEEEEEGGGGLDD